MKRSNTAAIIFNAAIFGMTVFGYLISVFFPQQNRLPATGALGLRYFTTLSNFFFHLVIPLAAICGGFIGSYHDAHLRKGFPSYG